MMSDSYVVVVGLGVSNRYGALPLVNMFPHPIHQVQYNISAYNLCTCIHTMHVHRDVAIACCLSCICIVVVGLGWFFLSEREDSSLSGSESSVELGSRSRRDPNSEVSLSLSRPNRRRAYSPLFQSRGERKRKVWVVLGTFSAR
jgi:hypothetical protein